MKIKPRHGAKKRPRKMIPSSETARKGFDAYVAEFDKLNRLLPVKYVFK